jgi:hypothetical protein
MPPLLHGCEKLTLLNSMKEWGREDEIFNVKAKMCVVWPQEANITKYKQFKLNYYRL